MPTIDLMHFLPSQDMQHRDHRPARLPRAVVIVLVLATALIGFNPGTPDADAATSFTISGSGWGHGVGMSQWGARGRAANRNETFRQILAYYYRGTAVESRPVTNDIRVLAKDNVPTVSLKASAATVINGTSVPAGATINVTSSGQSLALSGAVNATVAAPLSIATGTAGGPASNTVTVTVGNDTITYPHGVVSVGPGEFSGLRVIIGSLTMQQYLYGLGEMPMSWPIEALKSQITAARTYTQKQISVRRGTPKYAQYDVNATLDGAYTGSRHTGTTYFTNNWKPAVDATDTLVITYGGALIDAVYSASSGGHTVDSETGFITALPYLRGVPDPDDLTGNNPNASWSVTFTAAELGAWFGVGTVTSISLAGTPPASGHIDKVNVVLTGTSGSKTVTGAKFRADINARAGSARMIRSTMFSIDGATQSGSDNPPPATPRYPTGAVTVARADGRTVIIEGTASDPDGSVWVQVVSTMGRERAVRNYTANGPWRSSWTGAPGTRNVCVTIFDNPTGKAISLGCRDVVVK